MFTVLGKSPSILRETTNKTTPHLFLTTVSLPSCQTVSPQVRRPGGDRLAFYSPLLPRAALVRGVAGRLFAQCGTKTIPSLKTPSYKAMNSILGIEEQSC